MRNFFWPEIRGTNQSAALAQRGTIAVAIAAIASFCILVYYIWSRQEGTTLFWQAARLLFFMLATYGVKKRIPAFALLVIILAIAETAFWLPKGLPFLSLGVVALYLNVMITSFRASFFYHPKGRGKVERRGATAEEIEMPNFLERLFGLY